MQLSQAQCYDKRFGNQLQKFSNHNKRFIIPHSHSYVQESNARYAPYKKLHPIHFLLLHLFKLNLCHSAFAIFQNIVSKLVQIQSYVDDSSIFSSIDRLLQRSLSQPIIYSSLQFSMLLSLMCFSKYNYRIVVITFVLMLRICISNPSSKDAHPSTGNLMARPCSKRVFTLKLTAMKVKY